MWAAYFPRGEIHGVDIDPEARQYAGKRVVIHIGDASQAAVLDPILAQVGGQFDVIIDDGSHRYEHQLRACCAVAASRARRVVRDRDVHTSYRKK